MTPKPLPPGLVYLLHFDELVGNARHYIGFCGATRLNQRMVEHQQGFGASLTALASARQIGFTCARVWVEATPQDERRIKRQGHHNQKCPICEPALVLRSEEKPLVHYPPFQRNSTWSPTAWSTAPPNVDP